MGLQKRYFYLLLRREPAANILPVQKHDKPHDQDTKEVHTTSAFLSSCCAAYSDHSGDMTDLHTKHSHHQRAEG